MKTEKMNITLSSEKKKQLMLYATDHCKSVSNLIEISTTFYMNSKIHARELSSSLFNIAECITHLENTTLTNEQQLALNGIKKGVDTINGCFKN